MRDQVNFKGINQPMITITLLCANQFEASTLNKGIYLFVCFFVAFCISHMAIKAVFNAEDGLVPPQHDITYVKKLVFDHFKV